MIFISFDMEEVEAALKLLLEAGSWMGWWLIAVHTIVIANSPDEWKCHLLFLAGTRTIKIFSERVSVLWVSSILKRQDDVLLNS